MDFKLVSEYQPTGDQPQAIESLVKGIKEGEMHQTLLGLQVLVKLLPWQTSLKM